MIESVAAVIGRLASSTINGLVSNSPLRIRLQSMVAFSTVCAGLRLLYMSVASGVSK